VIGLYVQANHVRGKVVTEQDEAFRMLDVFASVGATHFDLTHLDIDGEKRGFRPQQTIGQLKNSLPKLFPGATQRQNNIIVRPHSDKALIVQLDDLDESGLKRVGEAAFLTLQTSPGNHQAWIAVSDMAAPQDAKDFSRRLRKGAGADATASGATRIAGTTNYKRKYGPDFPTVAILNTAPGRVVSAAQLEALGLVAEPEPVKPATVTPLRVSRRHENAVRARRWPDYQRCLEGAPESKSRPGKRRESLADFTWCMTALDWGHSIEETANHLMQVSSKARENGERYASLTAGNAAAVVARKGQGHARG
jgi:hypothetical protein